MARKTLGERLRPWRPLIILVAVALGAVNLYMCKARDADEAAHKSVLEYLKYTFPPVLRKTQGVLTALSGLVADGGPATSKAVLTRLDDEILPDLDTMIRETGAIAPANEAARALHRDYYHLIESMRDDVRALRADFAGPGTIAEQRLAARGKVTALHDRFEAFYADLRQRAAAMGVHFDKFETEAPAPKKGRRPR